MDEEHQTGEEYLLQRWPSILQLEDVDYEKYCAAKEEWFGEAFTFLRGLPPGEHVCCHHRAVMSLLLEPFYHYYSQTGEQKGQLAELWRHISSDFSGCTACIMTYHRAVEQLQHEYTPEALAPLLETLARLDEERVVELLKRIRLKIAGNEYNRNKEADNTQLACALFEILMFPSLLEDAEVSELFAHVLEFTARERDLTLANGERYPGVYWLLLHKSKAVRQMAKKLCVQQGKIRDANDMELIQPLIKRCMHLLEFDLFGQSGQAGPQLMRSASQGLSGGDMCRPRAKPTKEELWLGLQSL